MNREDIKNYLDKFNIIFYGIIAIPLVAFSYLYLEDHAGRLHPNVGAELIETLRYLFPTVIIVVSGAGIVLSESKIRRIDLSRDLNTKLLDFRRILILRYAYIEAACILSVIAFYLTLESFYAVFFVATLVMFSLNRPTAHRVISNLKITGDEKDLF